MIRVVTTFSRAQWQEYVHKLLPRSIELWPQEIEWQVWLDRPSDCWLEIEDSNAFTETHKNIRLEYLSDDPEHEAFMADWKRRVEDNPALKQAITVKRYPTGYTLDAGTFAHKVFALTGKEARQGADWLIFLGSDVETLERVEIDWLERILAGDIVHLGRRDIRSSETDWLAVYIGEFGVGTEFLNALRYLYNSGDIYNWAEFIDGHIIGRLCAIFQGMGADVRNLSEGLPGLDVWSKTVLGERLVHHKGPRGKLHLKEKLT